MAFSKFVSFASSYAFLYIRRLHLSTTCGSAYPSMFGDNEGRQARLPVSQEILTVTFVASY